MSKTFDEQLERVRNLAKEDPTVDPDESWHEDQLALRAVLDQRDRLRTALDSVHGILQSNAVKSCELVAHIHGHPYTG